jgi:hypothetical protein
MITRSPIRAALFWRAFELPRNAFAFELDDYCSGYRGGIRGVAARRILRVSIFTKSAPSAIEFFS